MRKLVVSNIVSLDGYYEGPGRDVMDTFTCSCISAVPDDLTGAPKFAQCSPARVSWRAPGAAGARCSSFSRRYWRPATSYRFRADPAQE